MPEDSLEMPVKIASPEYFLPQDLRGELSEIRKEGNPARRHYEIAQIRQEMYRRAYKTGTIVYETCEQNPDLENQDILETAKSQVEISPKQERFFNEVVNVVKEQREQTQIVIDLSRRSIGKLIEKFPEFRGRFSQEQLDDPDNHEVLGTALFVMHTGKFPKDRVEHVDHPFRIELTIQNGDEAETGPVFSPNPQFKGYEGETVEIRNAPLLIARKKRSEYETYTEHSHETNHHKDVVISKALSQVGEVPSYFEDTAEQIHLMEEIEDLMYGDTGLIPEFEERYREKIADRFSKLRRVCLKLAKMELLAEYRNSGDFFYVGALVGDKQYDFLDRLFSEKVQQSIAYRNWVEREKKLYHDELISEARSAQNISWAFRLIGDTKGEQALLGTLETTPLEKWSSVSRKQFPKEYEVLLRLGAQYGKAKDMLNAQNILPKIRIEAQGIIEMLRK